jgi:carbamoyltransferase
MRSTIELINFSDEELNYFTNKLFKVSQNSRTAVLGLSILAHDTSAALVSETSLDVIFASAEERFSNIKHDSGFPLDAISKCLEFADNLDYRISEIIVNYDPNLFITEALRNRLSNNLSTKELDLLCTLILTLDIKSSIQSIKNEKFEELIEGILETFESKVILTDVLAEDLFRILKWFIATYLKYKSLGEFVTKLFSGIPISYVRHHDAHAATAYVGMGVEDATVIVVDGHGESDALSIYKFNKGKCLETLRVHWPISLGALYLAGTRSLGFDYGDEYKVMGMAAYGTDAYDFIFDGIFEVCNGEPEFIGNSYWEIRSVEKTGMIRISPTSKLSELLGTVNNPDELKQIHFNFAHSLQKNLELVMLQILSSLRPTLISNNIGISGGVALNGLMNEAIRKSGIFGNVFAYPAAGDDGTSVGAALYRILEKSPTTTAQKEMDSCYFGFTDDSDLELVLEKYPLNFAKSLDINSDIAKLLFRNEIVCRFAGSAEFGPRALGNRSILANPSSASNKDVLNERIKHREKFRPFAPAVPLEFCEDYFEISVASPFMLFITKARVKCKEVAPAVVHVDGTARVQTVTAEANPDLYSTIMSFYELSGVPIIINTSFNLNGEAIVNNFQDAIESFIHMDVDFLAIENYIVTKRDIQTEESDADFLERRISRYFNGGGGKLRLVDCRTRGQWFT